MRVSLLLSGAVIVTVVFFALRAREDISQIYIENATASAVRQFARMAPTAGYSFPETTPGSIGRATQAHPLVFGP